MFGETGIDITGLRTQLVKKMFSKQKHDVYHTNFSSMIQHIADMAKKLYGITIDPKTVTDTAKNKNKPKAGVTKKFSLKGDKGSIKAFVYNRGGLDNPFELRMYQEGVELEEDGPCWDTHKQVGMKKKDGRMVPNCVPKNEEPRIPRKKGQPAGSDKHSDLYTDENPVGTIHGLGFKDVKTAKASVKKIIGSGKTHAHKIQAAIAMEQRAKEMGKTAEAAVYRAYIEKMKKKTKEMQNEKAPDTADAMKRYKAGKAGFTDIAHLKATGKIKRADGTKKKSPKYEESELNEWGEVTEKAEYDGRPVDLNNPTKGDRKKYKVYVKNEKGNVVKVEFGDPNMEIKRDDPGRRANFRARHNCDNPGPKYKARYWSCKFWSAKSVTDLMKG